MACNTANPEKEIKIKLDGGSQAKPTVSQCGKPGGKQLNG